jgi:hypothetical protein
MAGILRWKFFYAALVGWFYFYSDHSPESTEFETNCLKSALVAPHLRITMPIVFWNDPGFPGPHIAILSLSQYYTTARVSGSFRSRRSWEE